MPTAGNNSCTIAAVVCRVRSCRRKTRLSQLLLTAGRYWLHCTDRGIFRQYATTHQGNPGICLSHSLWRWRSRIFWSATSRSEEHTSELQSREKLVCRLLLEKKEKTIR